MTDYFTNHKLRRVETAIQQCANESILCEDTKLGYVLPEWFVPDYWEKSRAINIKAGGRGKAWFVGDSEHNYVLRHYRRGGMVANLSEDKYIWLGLERTRAWREWKLLAQLYEQALPVPQPVAARVVRQLLTYTADIITQRIPDTRTLANLLSENHLAEKILQMVGATIRRFHEAGVFHADLNANNILLQVSGQAYLIDFDKCCLKQPHKSWQEENLQRLHRSLTKLKSQQTAFHFNEQDWTMLLSGYNSTE